MLVTGAVRSLRQEDHEYKVSLGYIVRLSQKQMNSNKKEVDQGQKFCMVKMGESQ
jgi:predicted HTH domain antitoxin